MSFAELTSEIDELDRSGLKRQRRVLQSATGPRAVVDGKVLVAFCSNDYLGLAADPRLVEAAVDGARRHGVGAGASHLLAGHSDAHHDLEQALARFVGAPRALLFSTGYMANLAIVTALCGRADAVFADRLNHASLNDAALLSRASFKRYAHCDMAALESMLAASRARRKLVVSDAVFSMDGDIAPVPDLLALCERHGAWLMIDDAHGFGVLGDTGAGSLRHFGIACERLIYMATLGKATGVFGAFVAASGPVIELLTQRARTYIYTTATPPLLARALLASLSIVEKESWRRNRLAQLVHGLGVGAQGLRWSLMPSTTPIQPLLIGESAEATRVSDALLARGLLVPAIRPPTVPQSTARLRISLSAAHTEDDLARLVGALREIDAAS